MTNSTVLTRAAEMWALSAANRWSTPGALARALDPDTRQTRALDLIDAALVDVAEGRCDRLIISMPPQEGKSSRVTTVGALWFLLRKRHWRIAIASYSEGLAVTFGRLIRNYIADHQGRDGTLDLGVRIAADNGAVTDWTLAGNRGGIRSVGIGTGLTGRPVDCVSGDTYIDCEHGRIAAAEAFERGITRILAYDHTTGRTVWRDVEAARRIPGRRVITVVTASGRRITCTPDHRVYTGRGYVPAGSLRRGDSLVAILATTGMPVREPLDGAEDGRAQGDPARTEPLLQPVVRQRWCGRDEPVAVLPVRSADPEESGVNVLVGMPFGDAGRATSRAGMSSMRRPVSAEVITNDILLEGLRKCGSLVQDDRPGQLALQDGRVLCSLVPINAPTGSPAGQRALRGLRRPTCTDLRAERQDRDALGAGDTSHRRGRSEQSAGEPHYTLPHLPRDTPQVVDDAVAVVLDRGDLEIDVYDFQVAGTRNFFGDGVLVHNCLIIDDPIKDREQADSETYRERAKNWWRTVGSTRLAPGAPVILILTRWHHDDLAGYLLGQPDKDRWRVINIPAQAEHRPDAGESDILGREPGEYMDSARIDERTGLARSSQQWEQTKIQVGPETWAALYQGSPTATTGNILPRDKWRQYDTPLWIEDADGRRFIPGLQAEDAEMIQSWDFTFKDTAASDYVVGQVWLRRGIDAYLLDQVRARMDFTASCQAMLTLSARWPQAIAKLVEDKANGPAILNALRSQVGGLIPVEPEGSKVARARAISPLQQAGNLWLPSPMLAPWVGDFIEEAAQFPHGKNDDQVDGASQAVHRLLLVPILAGQTLYPEDVLGDGVELDWVADLDY